MGIESTKSITREDAIERIKLIAKLISDEDALGLEQASSEDTNADDFIEYANNLNYAYDLVGRDLSKVTNSRLELIMDKQFYRYSMFENYTVEGE